MASSPGSFLISRSATLFAECRHFPITTNDPVVIFPLTLQFPSKAWPANPPPDSTVPKV